MMNHWLTHRFLQTVCMGSLCLGVASVAQATQLSSHKDCERIKLPAVPITLDSGSLSTQLLQQIVMDFSDEYMSSIGEVLNEYIATETDPAKRVAAQSWRVRYNSAAMSIASARDPRTNLLDMVVFIAAGKWAVNSYWIPKVFGEKAAPLAEVYQRMDRKIWTIAGEALTQAQQSDLRQLITTWEHSHPRMHEVATARLRNLDGVHLNAFDDGMRGWGILESLRKFLKKVDKSLLSGERVMFCLNHTPQILSEQSDLTIAQVAQAFPLAAVNPEMIVGAVKGFPSVLQEGINKNEGWLNTILPQLGGMLKSADSLATTLNKSVQTLDGSGKIADPAAVVRDANQALSHLDASISGINQLLSNNAIAGLQSAEISRQIDAQSGRLMDAAFHRILLLIGVFFGGTIGTLLVVKVLFFQRTNQRADS